MKQTAKDIVLTFISALNNEDFEAAGACLAEDMAFDGVMGKRDSAESYISDMKKMKFKYDIQKIFENEDDVCVLYNINMGGNATIFTCGWYQLSYGKIKKLKVVFDPRPLLKDSDKQ